MELFPQAPLPRERRCDPFDAVCVAIIAAKGATRIVVRSMSEADVRAIAAEPSAQVGWVGPCVAPSGISGQGKPYPSPHRTFPWLIGHYARDLGLLTLPQAIAKMTGGAASALGLADRGLLREGQAAGGVLFDRATIIDRSTCDDPHQYPADIGTVIVNGAIVIDGGEQAAGGGASVRRLSSTGVTRREPDEKQEQRSRQEMGQVSSIVRSGRALKPQLPVV